MTTVTLAEICDAIEDTLATATGIRRSSSYDEIVEDVGSADLPFLQVWPFSGACDVSGMTDRTTSRGGRRQYEFDIYCDVFCAQIGRLGENMQKTVAIIDALMDVLDAQEMHPLFGLDGIKAFRYRFEVRPIIYADTAYAGVRFTITVRVF